MLVPRPPASVGQRRAVAETIVAYRQAAPIVAGHVLVVLPDVPVAGMPDVDARGAGDGLPIYFSVVYRLPEYLTLLREYLPRGMLAWDQARGNAAAGRLSWSVRVALALLIPIVGTPTFLLKKRRMPICRFKIDGEHIERDAGGGRLRVAWRDVRAVHRLTRGYLIDKGNGALPLPYRCLRPGQRAAFERLLVSRFGNDTPV